MISEVRNYHLKHIKKIVYIVNDLFFVRNIVKMTEKSNKKRII